MKNLPKENGDPFTGDYFNTEKPKIKEIMKTIKITNEMHKSLMALSKEMTSQDMRCTRMPHMFQIKTKEEVAAYDGCGEEIWCDDDLNILRTDEEIKDWIQEDIFENDESLHGLNHDEAKKISKQKALEEDHYIYLDQHRDNWRILNITTEDKYQNTFFTAKACQEHIDSNSYHYNKPSVYLNSAWRNPEMELVSRFLCELSGGKLHQ